EKVEKQLIDARVTLGLYYNQMYYFAKAYETVSPIVDLALKQSYKQKISQIKAIIGTYIFGVEGNYPRGIQYLEEALEIAKELNDRASLWIANHWLGHALAEYCEFEKALYHLNKAIEISKAANLLWSISIMKSCIANTVYNTQGNAELGHQISLEGLAIAEESGDAMSKAEAYVHHGISCFLKGYLNEAERHLLNGEKYCKKIDYASGFLASRYLGLIYLEKGSYSTSQDYFMEAITTMENRGAWISSVYLNKISLAYSKAMQYKKDINIELLYKYEKENKIKALEGQMALGISQILLTVYNHDNLKTENWVQKAIAADQQNGQTWYLGRDYVTYAELFLRKNKT
ncbi:MAG: tetratricopeptide repeat protein, partial [Deltaproteobacteria bacterium]|nr:tetratricopeptide repeat protein [Deltaproteobacteria bacterium]